MLPPFQKPHAAPHWKPTSLGQRCDRVNLSLKKKLCSFVRLTNCCLTPCTLTHGKQTTERPSVCGQPMQKSTIGQAHMILRHDDSRSLNTRAFDCCTNSACTPKCTIFIMHNSDERCMLERNSVMTSSRRRQQMKRRWIL